MPYVSRDEQGNIKAIGAEPDGERQEELPSNHPAVREFLQEIGQAAEDLERTDAEFVRVTEDLIDLLIAKGVILFTDLPEEAQQKILFRRKLRAGDTDSLNLLGDD